MNLRPAGHVRTPSQEPDHSEGPSWVLIERGRPMDGLSRVPLAVRVMWFCLGVFIGLGLAARWAITERDRLLRDQLIQVYEIVREARR